jgi:hypothetical protein
MASYLLAMARLQTYFAQARYGETPARHGEGTGPGLNYSRGEHMLAMAKFISPEPSSRHERSLATRCGEFMQKCPCFAKIIKLP